MLIDFTDLSENEVQKTSIKLSKVPKSVNFKMPHKKEPTKIRRIGESGYVLPDHIPPGEIVHGLKRDENIVKQESWRIGKSIGKRHKLLYLGLKGIS